MIQESSISRYEYWLVALILILLGEDENENYNREVLNSSMKEHIAFNSFCHPHMFRVFQCPVFFTGSVGIQNNEVKMYQSMKKCCKEIHREKTKQHRARGMPPPLSILIITWWRSVKNYYMEMNRFILNDRRSLSVMQSCTVNYY